MIGPLAVLGFSLAIILVVAGSGLNLQSIRRNPNHPSQLGLAIQLAGIGLSALVLFGLAMAAAIASASWPVALLAAPLLLIGVGVMISAYRHARRR